MILLSLTGILPAGGQFFFSNYWFVQTAHFCINWILSRNKWKQAFLRESSVSNDCCGIMYWLKNFPSPRPIYLYQENESSGELHDTSQIPEMFIFIFSSCFHYKYLMSDSESFTRWLVVRRGASSCPYTPTFAPSHNCALLPSHPCAFAPFHPPPHNIFFCS